MNWQTKKLGEICEERKEKNVKHLDLPVYAVSNIFGFVLSEEFFYKRVYSESLRSYKLVYKGDFAYNPARVNVGSIGLFKEETPGLISPMYIVFYIKDKNLLDSNFLFYLLKTNLYRNKIKNLAASQGSVRQILKLEDLLNLEIPIPPLPIQQKIVKILDTIQSAVDIHDKIIEKTKELKRSLMNLLFHYGLAGLRVKELASSRVGELSSSELEKLGLKLKKTEIGEIPDHWEVVRLGDKKLFELVMGQSPPSSSYNQNKKGLPFLQGKAEFGEIYPQPIKWCDSPIKSAEKNDILISVRAPVGDLNLADQKYCIGRGLAAIRVKNNVDSFFLFNCLNFFKNQFLTYETGSTFKAITREVLENFIIPLPPLPEQQEIAEILQTIDQKIEIEKKKKELYHELFKTLLNKIMNQEIDVNLLDY
jgi:type I restriction enzyme S subunit